MGLTPPPMPLATPFLGERYAARDLSDLLAPPYDVIGPGERDALTRRHEHNIVRLILPENGDDRYRLAGDRYRQWRRQGVLVADKTASAYVARQEFTTPDGLRHTRTGAIAAVAVEPYALGRVRPHERTHAGPKADRLALLRESRAMFESLFMLTRDEGGELATLLEEASAKRPNATAELQGVQVTLWRVTGKRARALADAAGQGALYVADGHHRYETALAYRGESAGADRVPALIVPFGDPGLVVFPTHRLVHGAPVSRERVFGVLRERVQMRDLPPNANYLEELGALATRGAGCVVVLPDGPAVAILLKSAARDLEFAKQPAVASLDVARLDDQVVKQLVAEAGADARLEYTPAADRVMDDVHRGIAAAGVLLNPTPAAAVLAVADAGAVMPQKSTFFYPKVPSGLVVMRYP